MKITSLKELPPACWAGGKTWQLLIIPADSSLTERNFDYRLSSASIESPHSVFSSFPGYERDLVSLTETVRLKVSGRSFDLTPMQVFHFSGDDPVESDGTTQDLNLIKGSGLPGKLEIIRGKICGPALVFDSAQMALLTLADGEEYFFQEAVKVSIPSC